MHSTPQEASDGGWNFREDLLLPHPIEKPWATKPIDIILDFLYLKSTNKQTTQIGRAHV